MAAVPTTNSGTTYYNQNNCFSFNQTIGTSLVQLSAYVCSEIIIVNKTGGNVVIFDNGYNAANAGFLLSNNDQFIFRGITSSAVVSASANTTGSIYCRTQFYSYSSQTTV